MAPKTKAIFYKTWMNTRELALTVIVICWLIVCLFYVTFTNAYLDRANHFVHIPFDQRTRVSDPILEFLHPLYLSIGFPTNFTDSFCQFSGIIMLLRVILAKKKGFLLTRRTCFIISLGYLIRIPFTLMTMLPNPNLECSIDPNSNLFFYALEIMTQKKTTCGDVIYSGHTVLFMAASLVWVENPVRWFSHHLTSLVNFIAILFSLSGVTIMIASSHHYTVDCVISILTNLYLWKFYHFIVQTHYFDHTHIGHLIKWLENNHEIDFTELPPACYELDNGLSEMAFQNRFYKS